MSHSEKLLLSYVGLEQLREEVLWEKDRYEEFIRSSRAHAIIDMALTAVAAVSRAVAIYLEAFSLEKWAVLPLLIVGLSLAVISGVPKAARRRKERSAIEIYQHYYVTAQHSIEAIEGFLVKELEKGGELSYEQFESIFRWWLEA